mgnify:FL=1
MRNIGSSFGYINLALTSLLKGLNKLEINKEKLASDLDAAWEVLTEAIQTVLRKNNIPDGYELMKKISRGKEITRSDLLELIKSLDIPEDEKSRLLELTPHTYTGFAEELSNL